MHEHTVIGVGALLHSTAFGLVAVAASSRRHGVVLVDAGIVRAPHDARSVSGTLRNAEASAIAALCVDLLLLDRRGLVIAVSRWRIGSLAAGACCRVRSPALPQAAVRFRVEHAAQPRAGAADTDGFQRTRRGADDEAARRPPVAS